MRYVSLHLPAGDGGRAFLVSEDAGAYVIAVPVEVVDFLGLVGVELGTKFTESHSKK